MGESKRKGKISKTCTFLMQNNGFVPPSQLEKMSDKSKRSGRRSSMDTCTSSSLGDSYQSLSSSVGSASPSQSVKSGRIRRSRTMDSSVIRGVRARKRVIGLAPPTANSLEGEGLFR